MKKILLLTISLLLILSMAIGFSSCNKKKKGDDDAVFVLDTSEFNSVVVYGEELNLAGLKLRDSNGGVVDVESDMVGHIDTSTAGTHTFEVHFNGQTFTVEYTVKYQIIFIVNGVETEQLVVDASEVIVPMTPQIVGKQFDRWSIVIPDTLTENLRIEAIYKTLSSDREDIHTWTGSGKINLEGYAAEGAAIKLQVTDLNGTVLDASVASIDTSINKIVYTLGSYEGIIVSISGENGQVMSKSWQILSADTPEISVALDAGLNAIGFYYQEEKRTFKIGTGGSAVKFVYSVELSNNNVTSASKDLEKGYLGITPERLGVTKLILTATNAGNEDEKISIESYVVVQPYAGFIVEHNGMGGNSLEDVWTVGRVNVEGLGNLKVTVAGNVGEGFWENVVFNTTSSYLGVNSVAGQNGIGSLSFGDTWVSGKVEDIQVYATFKPVVDNVTLIYNSNDTIPDSNELEKVPGFRSSAVSALRYVHDGVNVTTYDQLWAETNKATPSPIVLQGNIKEDFSATNHTVMQSTYDITYYENVGQDAYINVLIQFKNNVYGNGYEINAQNATIGMLDNTGTPKSDSLFKGPLYFVALANGAINVKAQDNIVFGVYENVTLNNVTLKSCDLSVDSETGTVDLTELDYAGTTVEVLGDNVNIEYSRLMNGRTILRIFGDDDNAEQEIHVNVKNTLLKGSREFNARIGSNRFYKDESTASPMLPGDTVREKAYYKSKKEYANWSAEQKAAYDDKYINTYVVFENVVLEDAGIFAIGMDTHFSGPLLNGKGDDLYGAELLKYWHDLAKTSYGAKLTLQDDVRIYTWKNIEDVDSSTLIENIEGSGLKKMDFNIKEIIKETVKTQENTYKNLFFNYEGVDYVHAGIAYFGGGKNYSIVENNISAENSLGTFSTYETRLSLVGHATLEYAAGSEYFHFMVYDKVSGFTYLDQENLSNKYDCLRGK